MTQRLPKSPRQVEIEQEYTRERLNSTLGQELFVIAFGVLVFIGILLLI